MKDLEFNKVAASVLVAGIIAMTAGHISKIAYNSGVEKDAKRGYQIEGAEDMASSDTASAPKEDKAPDILALLATADVNSGKEQAKKCVACHSFDKGGANKVGPYLWGAVGGSKGHRAEGYAYSKVLSGMTGTWGYEEVAAFLYAPQKYAPGTKMSFAGVKKPQDLANLVAYLRTLSDSPLPLPAAK